MSDREETYGKGTLQWLKQGPGECVAKLRIDLPKGPDGKRHRRSFTLKGSKRHIEKERTRILHELHEGAIAHATAPKQLSEYLKFWLVHAVDDKLAARTAVNYRQYIEYYIIPHLGHLAVSALTPTIIQAFYTTLRKSGRRLRRKTMPAGLSQTTVSNCHRVFTAALKQAVLWHVIPANPAVGVSVPKPRSRKPIILSKDQVATVLMEGTHPQLRALIAICVMTGIRRGEAHGLKWDKVNLEEKVLTIENTLVDTGHEVIQKGPKTEDGMRAVKMPQLLADALGQQLALQQEHKELLREAYRDEGFVICWEDGRYIHPQRLYHPFRRLIKRLGLPAQTRLHDLRHSHATHLLESKVHIKTVSERLGHKDIQTTLNIYSHVMPHIQQEAADATDETLGGALLAWQQKSEESHEEGT